MGRLQAVVLTTAGIIGVLGLIGCDDSKTKPAAPIGTTRREAVLAPSGQATAALTPPASAPAHAAIAPKPRTICTDPPLNRPFPADKVSHAQAPGVPPLGDTVAVGGGRWTWVNLWAAWCAPCKEEMPRLVSWQVKLSSSMNLAFVSLDDDDRQLDKFLESQPANAMRSSYWLTEGKQRDGWLLNAHLKTSPQLPVQILVNPQGRIHCVIEGAVEESDFARVSSIVEGR